jgi:toxin HigB-1
MEVSFSSSFRRAFKKRVKGKTDLEARFWAKVEVFTSERTGSQSRFCHFWD